MELARRKGEEEEKTGGKRKAEDNKRGGPYVRPCVSGILHPSSCMQARKGKEKKVRFVQVLDMPAVLSWAIYLGCWGRPSSPSFLVLQYLRSWTGRNSSSYCAEWVESCTLPALPVTQHLPSIR